MTAPQHRRLSPAPVDSFDAQIDQEWREFRAELADVVAGLDDEVVDVQVSTGGAPEFLQADLQIVIRRDEERPDVLLVSVPRNEQLGPFASTLSRGQLAKVRALAADGWSGEGWYWWELPADYCDQAADMAVRYVRDIVGVISPALLHTNLQSLDEALLSPWRGHNRQVSTVSGMVPASEQHLRELVVDALVDSFELEIDGDGDVVIIAGGRLMWAWPSHETDYIRLATLVTDDLPDPEEALPLVNELGFRCEGTKLFVKGQKLVAFRDVLVVPFFAAALVDQVHDLTATTEQLAEHLPQHLGAARQAWCGGDTDPWDWPSLG